MTKAVVVERNSNGMYAIKKVIEEQKKERTLLRTEVQIALIRGKQVPGGLAVPGGQKGQAMQQDMLSIPRAVKVFSRHGMYCVILDEDETMIMKIPHDNIFRAIEQKIQVPISVIEADRKEQAKMKQQIAEKEEAEKDNT